MTKTGDEYYDFQRASPKLEPIELSVANHKAVLDHFKRFLIWTPTARLGPVKETVKDKNKKGKKNKNGNKKKKKKQKQKKQVIRSNYIEL